jgi:hypothetical protein
MGLKERTMVSLAYWYENCDPGLESQIFPAVERHVDPIGEVSTPTAELVNVVIKKSKCMPEESWLKSESLWVSNFPQHDLSCAAKVEDLGSVEPGNGFG